MELTILDAIQRLRTPYLDMFFSVLTRMGDHAEIWLLLVFIMFWKKERRSTAFLAIVSIAIELLIVSVILKPLFMRARPYTLADIELLIPIPIGSSFPSGHSASSFAVAFLLFRENASYKYLILFTAFLMAFSRLYVYVHYPSDVLVGSLIGIVIGEFVYRNQVFFIEVINRCLRKVNLSKYQI